MAKERTEVLEQVRKIVCEQLDVSADAVVETASFVDDLGADSLAIVELVLAMEEHFGTTIPDDQTEKMRAVGDVVTYIHAHQA